METQGSVIGMKATRDPRIIRKAVVKNVLKGERVTTVARMFRVSNRESSYTSGQSAIRRTLKEGRRIGDMENNED